jgi:hypothetical protein
VDLRVWLQRLTPGVENAQEADLSSQMLWIGCYFQQSGGASFEQKSKQSPFVLPDERSQPVRHAEDEIEIVGREKFLLPRLKPFIPRVGLTLRAMAVAAGVVGDGLKTAAVALIAVTAQSGCPAARNGVQHLDLWPG